MKQQQQAISLPLIIFVGFLLTLIQASNFFKTLETPSFPGIIYKEDASLTCPKRYYQDPINSLQCLPCSSNCENCNGPLPTDCLTRILAKTCSSSQYLYWDGNCDSSCNSPLVATTSTDSSTDNTCSYICSNSQFLYWTGTCDSSCTGLYQSSIVHNKQLCDTKCPSSYTYWDGSCGTTCDFPLTNSTLVGRNFCEFTCTSQSDYLYYDGTCSSTCSYPLVNKAQKSRNFCDANCMPPQWANWESACMSSCDPPVVQRVEYGRWFCDYPCATTQFLYFNGTCGTVYCPNPYIYYSTNSRNFCESPCYAAGTYLDPNDGSCSATCSSSKYSYSINGRKICTSSCPSTYYLYWNGTCSASCPSPYVVTGTNTCESPCYAYDEYLYSDGTCGTSCDSPLTSTTEDGRKFCSSTCDSTEYLNSDGSCTSTCNSPNVASLSHGNKICTAKCETGEYKYWDGSCESSCVSPLISGTSGTTKTCSYNCASSEYLYFNGSCETSCDSPLVSTVTHGYYLCDSPCASSGKYLYWDGTCSSSCASPLVKSTDTSRNFCTYPCDSSTEYLKSDGSCSTTCNSPYVITQYKSVNFCLSPCGTGKYRYFNNSCLSTCNSPLVAGNKNGELYCDYPCATSEYLYYDGSCKTSCPSPYQATTEAGYKYCNKKSTTTSTTDDYDGFLKKAFLLAPTEAGTTSLVCLVKIMHYIRYLDIEMPPRLERLVQSQPRNILTLQYGATMPSEITDGFGEYSLIPVFQKPGNHSSFFVSYFQTFTSIAIALFVGFCLQFLEKLSIKKSYKTWQSIFEVLRVIFKWNFCLILLAFNIDFIILYTFLEFDTAGRSLGSGLPNFSLATNIFMILTGVIFLIGLICFIRKIYQTTTTKVAPEPTTNTVSTQENYLIVTGRWQGFRVLYTGFKETSKVARYFYLIYTIRIGLPMILACGLYHFPMINTTLQVMLSIYFLVFILIVRPIKKRINMIQLVLFETLAFMMNFCIFYLTAINTYDYDAQGTRVRLGDAVVIGNSLTNLLSLIFLALKLSIELKTLIPLLPKMTKHEKYASFAKLVLIWVQQGAMGFESIFDELIPTGSPRNPRTDQTATVNTETGLKNSPRIKRRGAAFPTLTTEGDLQTQGDNTFDNYAASTRRLKDMTPGTGRIFNDNASSIQISLKDNLSQLGGSGRGASANTEDTSCIGTQVDTSPTLRRGGNKHLSFADGAGYSDNSKGNSKVFTPQKNFEPLFVQNKGSPGTKFRSNIKKEPYYNYNNTSGNNNGNKGEQNQGMNNTSIHPYSASSAFSLDISDNSPQMRQPGNGNRRLDRTGTNLLASGTSKIYEEERGASEVDDDRLDGKAARWNYSYHTAVSQNLERDYNLPPEEEIHSKMQRQGTWQYWKSKGREKKPEKSVFEYSDVTITKK